MRLIPRRVWLPNLPNDDGPVACSDYELKRLETIVANARVLVTLFGSDNTRVGEEEVQPPQDSILGETIYKYA